MRAVTHFGGGVKEASEGLRFKALRRDARDLAPARSRKRGLQPMFHVKHRLQHQGVDCCGELRRWAGDLEEA